MEISKVRQKWNDANITVNRSVSWLSISDFGIDAVKTYLGEDFSNDLGCSLHNILLKRPGVDAAKLQGLAIACGDMVGELSILNSRVIKFSHIDGIDVSDVSLSRAVQNANAAGVNFNPIMADCNNIQLPENKYDMIVGHHAIHHIENLENLFAQVSRSLKPGGLFYCSEYIGPNYIMVPLMNRVFASLFVNLLVWPPDRRITHDHRRKLIITNPNFRLTDPSEAVRSSEIISVAKTHLNILKLHKFGGLNYPAFEGIGHHFTGSPQDKRLARQFIWIEKLLTRTGMIKPLFCFMLAEKKCP